MRRLESAIDNKTGDNNILAFVGGKFEHYSSPYINDGFLVRHRINHVLYVKLQPGSVTDSSVETVSRDSAAPNENLVVSCCTEGTPQHPPSPGQHIHRGKL